MNEKEDKIQAGIVNAIGHLQNCYEDGRAIAAKNIITSALKNVLAEVDEESADVANIRRSFVLMHGGCSVLLQAIKCAEDRDELALTFEILKVLSRNVDCSIEFARLDACQLVVSHMNSSFQDILEVVCSALNNLMRGSKDNLNTVVSCGGFEALLTLMISMSTNENFVFISCVSIAYALQNKNAFYKLKSLHLKSLLGIMLERYSVGRVGPWIIEILHIINSTENTFSNPFCFLVSCFMETVPPVAPSSSEMVETVRHCSVEDCLVKIGSSDIQVVLDGMDDLNLLTDKNVFDRMDPTRTHVAAVGGCATIVSASQKFAEPLVLSVALKLLKTLARNNDNSVPLHDAGVCELVIKNLASNIEILRQQAMSCFVSLCSIGDLNILRLFSLGGFDLVIDQMRKNVSDQYYLYTCSLAIECMFSNSDILQRMIALNVKSVLLLIKKKSPKGKELNNKIQEIITQIATKETFFQQVFLSPTLKPLPPVVPLHSPVTEENSGESCFSGQFFSSIPSMSYECITCQDNSCSIEDDQCVTWISPIINECIICENETCSDGFNKCVSSIPSISYECMTCNITSCVFCNPYYGTEKVIVWAKEQCDCSIYNPFDESNPSQSVEDCIVTCYDPDGNRVTGDSVNYFLHYIVDTFQSCTEKQSLNVSEASANISNQHIEKVYVTGDASIKRPLDYNELRLILFPKQRENSSEYRTCDICGIDFTSKTSELLTTATCYICGDDFTSAIGDLVSSTTSVVSSLGPCDSDYCQTICSKYIDEFLHISNESFIVGKLSIKCCYGSRIKLAENLFSSRKLSPYVKLRLESGLWTSTLEHKTTANLSAGKKPVWNEDFLFDIYNDDKYIEISVWHDDEDTGERIFLGGNLVPLVNWIDGKNRYEKWYKDQVKRLRRPDTLPIFTYNMGRFEGDLTLYDRIRTKGLVDKEFNIYDHVIMNDGSYKLAKELKVGDVFLNENSRMRKVISIELNSQLVTVVSTSGDPEFPDIDESVAVGRCFLEVCYTDLKENRDVDHKVDEREKEKRALLEERNPDLKVKKDLQSLTCTSMMYEKIFSSKDDATFPRLGVNIEALEHIARMRFPDANGKEISLEGKTTKEVNDLIKKHITGGQSQSYCNFLIREKQLMRMRKKEKGNEKVDVSLVDDKQDESKKPEESKNPDASKFTDTVKVCCNRFGKTDSSGDGDESDYSRAKKRTELFSPNDPIGNADTATVYVSHCWDAFFLETVEALKYHFQGRPNVYIWFDVLSMNQFADRKEFESKEWYQRTFRRAIERIGYTVLVFSPWQDKIFKMSHKPRTFDSNGIISLITSQFASKKDMRLELEEDDDVIEDIPITCRNCLRQGHHVIHCPTGRECQFCKRYETNFERQTGRKEEHTGFTKLEEHLAYQCEHYNENSFYPLARAWVLYELTTTFELGCKFDIAMSRNQEESFVKILKDKKESVSEFDSIISEIDSEFSGVSRESDEKLILGKKDGALTIDKNGQKRAFYKVNIEIHKQMRNWLVEFLQKRIVTAGGHVLMKEDLCSDISFLPFSGYVASNTISLDISKSPSRKTEDIFFLADERPTDEIPVSISSDEDSDNDSHQTDKESDRSKLLENSRLSFTDDIFPSTTVTESIFDLQKILCRVYNVQQDYQKAIQFLNALRRECRQPEKKYELDQMLGDVYLLDSKFEDAVHHYKNCLMIKEQKRKDAHNNLENAINAGSAYYGLAVVAEHGLKVYKVVSFGVNAFLGFKQSKTVNEPDAVLVEKKLLNQATVEVQRAKMMIARVCQSKAEFEKEKMKPEKEVLELYGKTEIIYKDILAEVKKKSGSYSVDALKVMDDLASFYSSVGDRNLKDLKKSTTEEAQSFFNQKDETGYMKAEKLLTHVVTQRKIDPGPDSVLTAATILRLANVQLKQADSNPKAFANAEPNFVAAVEKYKRILKESHPKTLEAVRDLGNFYYKKGNFSKAELLLEKCYSKYLEKLGDTHVDTLKATNNLALLYYQKGDYKRALDLYQYCLDMLTQSRGEHDELTVRVRNNLAGLYSAQGDNELAEMIYLKCLDSIEKISESRGLHQDTALSASIKNNFAVFLQKSGKDNSKARIYLNACKNYAVKTGITEKKRQPKDSLKLNCFMPLTCSYDERGCEYLTNCNTVLTGNISNDVISCIIKESASIPGAKLVPNSGTDISNFSDRNSDDVNEDYSVAVKKSFFAKFALWGDQTLKSDPEAEKLRKDFEKSDAEGLRVMNNLCSLNFDEAVHDYDHETKDTENRKRAIAKYETAIATTIYCLDLRQKLLGQDHVDCFSSMNNLASFYSHVDKFYDGDTDTIQKYWALADKNYDECQRKRREKLGADHPDTLKTMHDLGKLYFKMYLFPPGKDQFFMKAENILTQCLQKRRSKLGQYSPYTIATMVVLAKLYMKKKSADKEVYRKAHVLMSEAYEKMKLKLGYFGFRASLSENGRTVLVVKYPEDEDESSQGKYPKGKPSPGFEKTDYQYLKGLIVDTWKPKVFDENYTENFNKYLKSCCEIVEVNEYGGRVYSVKLSNPLPAYQPTGMLSAHHRSTLETRAYILQLMHLITNEKKGYLSGAIASIYFPLSKGRVSTEEMVSSDDKGATSSVEEYTDDSDYKEEEDEDEELREKLVETKGFFSRLFIGASKA